MSSLLCSAGCRLFVAQLELSVLCIFPISIFGAKERLRRNGCVFAYLYKWVRVESVGKQYGFPLGVSAGKFSGLSPLLLWLREPCSGTTASASSQGRERGNDGAASTARKEKQKFSKKQKFPGSSLNLNWNPVGCQKSLILEIRV